MRDQPRRRRHVPPALAPTLTPLFRYSVSRNAFILRGIGARRGPVLRLRPPSDARD